jgi:hypothetical protein
MSALIALQRQFLTPLRRFKINKTEADYNGSKATCNGQRRKLRWLIATFSLF